MANAGAAAALQRKQAIARAGRSYAAEWRERHRHHFDAMDRAWAFSDSRERHPVCIIETPAGGSAGNP